MADFKKHKTRNTVIIIAVILILTVGILAYMTLWTGINAKPSKNDSAKTINRIMNAQNKGEKVEISEQDINGILDTLFKKGIKKGGIELLDGYSKISGDSIDIFIKTKAKGLNLLLSSSGTIEMKNENLIFKPDSFKLGKLIIPKTIVLNKIKSLSIDNIKVSGDEIIINKYVLPFIADKAEIKNKKVCLSLEKKSILDELKPENGNKAGANNNTSNKHATVKDSEKVRLLRKISSQLGVVASAVKSSSEKKIVNEVNTVVNTMIDNPSYNYEAKMSKIKGQCSRLSNSEKEDLKNNIVANMNITEALKVLSLLKTK